MKTAINPSYRLAELDTLRGLAAFGVMLYHYTGRYTQIFHPAQPMAFQFFPGLYGVSLFFIISGFVIFMTLERTKRPADFIVSRFSRLYPCYWTAIIITFTLLTIFPLSPYIKNVSFKDALINLSMVQSWFGVRHVDGVYWTLTVELSFYILIFIVFALKKLKYIEELGLIALLIMVLNNRFLWLNHIHVPTVIAASQLLVFGNLFYAGILFYNIKTKGNAWHRHAALLLCLIVQYIVQDMMPQAPHVKHLIIFFLIFYLFIFNQLSFIIQKPLVYLGTISYSLYLTHEYIGYIIINHLHAFHVNAWACLIVPIACALLLATFITYVIEKPAMNYIRQQYKKSFRP